MLFRYSCKDMGLKCPFVVKGQSLEEVTQQALDHVRLEHQDDFNAIVTAKQEDEMRKALARSTHVVPG